MIGGIVLRLIVMCLVGCLSFLGFHTDAWAELKPDLGKNARSAILMDATTGAILYEKNSHESLPPASITKIMTMLLVMEALDEGKIKLQDQVRVSERAASMGGTQIYLEPGEQMSVDDLLKGVALASANDASVALAEFIAGSEERFVAMMNQKAKKLGLKNTHFVNTNGLPASGHVSSAYDIAVMSRELLKYPKITQYTRRYEDYLRKDSKKPFWLVNTNKLVRFYPGMDGLKTGFTQEAKYGLSATAKRGDMRVIAVVMGEPDIKTRNAEVTQMLDYAFQRYTTHRLFRKGERIGTVTINQGDPKKIPLYADQDLAVLLKRGESKRDIRHKLILNRMDAPIQKGQVIGRLQLIRGRNVLAEFPLQARQSVQKAGWWATWKNIIREYLFIP